MAETTIKEILLSITGDASKLEAEIAEAEKHIQKLAKSANISLKMAANSFKEALVEINANSRSGILDENNIKRQFKVIDEGLKQTVSHQKIIDANNKRATLETQKQAKAQQELNQRLKEGTANAREFGQALLGRSPILGGQLSIQSIQMMRGILPGKVDDRIVADVKRVMTEIQTITKQSTDRVRAMMREMFPNIDTEVINRAGKQLQGLPTIADRARHAFRQLWDTIKGTITAIGVFQVMQFISKFFEDAIENARKLHGELVQLDFAEAILSKRGMDITRAELDKFINDIRSKFKYLTQTEATSILSETASAVAEFDVSKQQLNDLANAIAFIQLKQKMMGQEAADAGHIINAAMDARSNYFNALGVNITEALVKEKAYAMGLAKTGEELDKNSRFQAILALLTEQTTEKIDELTNSIAGTREELDLIAAQDWEQITLLVGNFIEISRTGFLAIYMDLKNSLIPVLDDLIGTFEKLSTAVPDWLKQGLLGGFMRGADMLSGGLGSILGGTYLRGLMVENKPQTDTPTGPQEPKTDFEDMAAHQEEVAQALEKWNKAIIDEQLKFKQDMEEIEIDLGRELEDIAKEYTKKRADAYSDYNKKVRDINADFQNRVREIRMDMAEEAQQARNDELEREQEFQNRMLELKEKFLMDLEDALHERDARQVLRLIKNYNLEKEQAERDYELEKEKSARDLEERQQQFANDMKMAEMERQQKLAEARQELMDKLAQLKADEEAERAAAELEAQRKREDLEREMHNRLEVVAANLVAEYNLTKDELQRITGLYLKYYSDVTRIYAAMMTMFNAMRQLAYLSGTMTLGTAQSTTNPNMSVNLNPNMGGGGGGGFRHAEGGTRIANRPTTVTFGESGPEMATFIPIGRRGRDANKVFTNLSSSSSDMNGKIGIELLLSPDLESRIVKNTLNKTAEVITKVQRG